MSPAASPVANASPSKPDRPITGWHVLVAVVVFFGVVIGVDTLFIVRAYGTFSGQVASNPYEAGLEFNKTLVQRQREMVLGWTAAVETPTSSAVVVQVVDKAGAPLDHLSLTGVLERPATETGRQTLNFKPLGHGRYRADAHLDGAWDLRATARNGRDHLEFETRLLAKEGPGQ